MHFCLSAFLKALLQLAGLKALVRFSAVQRLKCSQAVIQSHFSELLAGVCMVEPESAAISSRFGLTSTLIPLKHQYSGFNAFHHLQPLSTVLLPVICRENTPSVLDVDFFHHLVCLAQGCISVAVNV